MSIDKLAEQFEDRGQQARAGDIGLWLFFATEMLLFGGLFAGFIIMRTEHPEAFSLAQAKLDLLLGTGNTLLLTSSTFAMTLAERSYQAGAFLKARWANACTVAAGLIFLIIKAYEWWQEYSEGLLPVLHLAFDPDDKLPASGELFFNFYFAMTGLHVVHMLVGMALLLSIEWRLARRQPLRKAYFRGVGLYWSFIDVIWITIFTLLYLL